MNLEIPILEPKEEKQAAATEDEPVLPPQLIENTLSEELRNLTGRLRELQNQEAILPEDAREIFETEEKIERIKNDIHNNGAGWVQ